MTPKELSKSISELDDPHKFDDISLNLSINGQDRQINSLATIHEFAYVQKQGWTKFEKLPNILESHSKFYLDLFRIIEIVYQTLKSTDKNDIKRSWTSYKGNNYQSTFRIDNYNYLNLKEQYLTYDNPSVPFLINLSGKFSSGIIQSAYNSIIGDDNSSRDREQVVGTVLAYEFLNKDSDITTRRKQEKVSLDKLRNDLSESLEGSKESLNEFYTFSKNKVDEFAQMIDDTKNEKSEVFDRWFNSTGLDYKQWYEKSKDSFTTWDIESQSKVKELENTYQEKLRLSEPVKYWNKRAEDLRAKGDKARIWLIGMIAFTVIFLIVYICISPSGLIMNVAKGNPDSMKWLLTSITIISFLAYGIRSFNKVMFSSYHLARDAEEREQLTYVYLALHNDNKIEESDRSIILQALFSRADTGLLKDDSSPTMPSAIIEKITKS